eukprot:9672013-Ditylum_brightwellii.AAC.1
MIVCYTCGGNHYANKCPDTKKTDIGTTVVTVGNGGSILDGDGWGSDEGLTGVMLCTEGVTKNYKNGLMSLHFKTNHILSIDHILQQTGGKINKNWVPLDNQSTVNIFCNAKLLPAIQKAGRSSDTYSNRGTSSTGLIDNLARFKIVWYQPDGIVNILFLASVQEEHHVTYDGQHG